MADTSQLDMLLREDEQLRALLIEALAKTQQHTSDRVRFIGEFLVQHTGQADNNAVSQLSKGGAVQKQQEEETLLPTTLRNFTPISMEADNARLSQLLKPLERDLLAAILEEKPTFALQDQIGVSVKQLRDSIQASIDFLLDSKNIIRTCDAVIEIGNEDFLPVYDAVWNLIQKSEGAGILTYSSAYAELNGVIQGVPSQRTKEVTGLFNDAAAAKPRFDAFMRGMQAATAADMSLPETLKRLPRVIEKAQLRKGDVGNVDGVKDVVRVLLIAQSMKDVAKLVRAFRAAVSLGQICVVQTKDRYVQIPSLGGWRDCMINFYMCDDPARHICEVQIAHSIFLVARKGLPGHVIYSRVRNATEILEFMGALDTTTRWQTVKKERDAGTKISKLVFRGFSGRDLSDGGYSYDELISAGIDTNENLDRAVLMDLFIATNGDNWTNKTNWGSYESLGTWHGVNVDADGRVVDLLLEDNNLSGTLLDSIGNLRELCRLHLHDNCLAGQLTPAMGKLVKLRSVMIGGRFQRTRSNHLVGSLPSTLGNLVELEHFDLANNGFTGEIPASLGKCENLKVLRLRGMKGLTGPLPETLGNLSKLEQIHLDQNMHTGPIPKSFKQLKMLEQIDVNACPLDGRNVSFIGHRDAVQDFLQRL